MRFKLTRVLLDAKSRSYFLKCVLMNPNQGCPGFLMVLNYCGFHLTEFLLFFIQKGFKRSVFSLGKRKTKIFNINRVA